MYASPMAVTIEKSIKLVKLAMIPIIIQSLAILAYMIMYELEFNYSILTLAIISVLGIVTLVLTKILYGLLESGSYESFLNLSIAVSIIAFITGLIIGGVLILIAREKISKIYSRKR